MIALEREGIFRAEALSWIVRSAEKSQAVAINIEFKILAELSPENEWKDWSEYEPHRVFGRFFVVKKDGTVNTIPIEQLAQSLGWDGDLTRIAQPPPTCIVQVNVKSSIYEEKTRYQVEWLNPGDFMPQPYGADVDDILKLQSQYGSLLRAVASSHCKKGNDPKTQLQIPPNPEYAAPKPGFILTVEKLNQSKIVRAVMDRMRISDLNDVPEGEEAAFIEAVKAMGKEVT